MGLVVKADDREHGTKDFLLGDAHVVGHIGEDGGLDEMAACHPGADSRLAAENATSTAGSCALNVVQNPAGSWGFPSIQS